MDEKSARKKRSEFLEKLGKDVWEKLNEKEIESGRRMDFYVYNLLLMMTTIIKSPTWSTADLHQMVHNIIKDIEAEASNAFLERKEK